MMEGNRRPRGKFKNKSNSYKKYKNHPKETPNSGEKDVIAKLQEGYSQINVASIAEFTDLPLTPKTLLGLEDCGYVTPTEIQRETIALSLAGQDVLGAARTGSGKTLAFLIPIIEKLFCLQWTRLDGLGALVITPTRELAYQIFGTLRKVGAHHDLSAGLIIGGKDLKYEWKRVDKCNIIICTPGRLLQHMDENPLFDCDNLQILVLDEADRCLDMGFQNAMNAIIENLPAQRQTLLFSATQTKSVQDLARLSLKDPMYVAVHETSTPDALNQSYIVCDLEEKITVLFSFIKNHLRRKIIVFMSSCKQVKYYNDIFCRLRLGPSILQLQGSLHQLRRMAVYESFCGMTNAVLFATDVAARGLDFPGVDWVVHLDCPEDVNTYIHRSGRTARFKKGGESLLILLPSEEAGMIEELKEKKVPITKIKINRLKLQSPIKRIESILAQFVDIKETAQRAFVAYIKSVFLMKNKKIFDVHALNTQAYSASLGMVVPPRIRFLQKFNKKEEEQRERREEKLSKREERAKLIEALRSTKKEVGEESSEDDDSSEDQDFNEEYGEEEEQGEDEEVQGEDEEEQGKDEEESYSENRAALTTKQPFQLDAADSDDDSEDEIFKVKRSNHNLEGESGSELETVEERKQANKKPLTKVAAAKKILRRKLVVNSKVLFDDEGEAIANSKREKISKVGIEYDAERDGGIDLEKARLAMIEEDKADKQRFLELRKAKLKEKKRLRKLAKKAEAADDEIEPIDEEERGPDEEHEESEGEEDDGPDMSWLPDPDAIYGTKEDDSKEFYNSEEENDKEQEDDSNEFYHSSEEEAVEEVHRPVTLKRKSKNYAREKFIRDKRSRNAELPMDTGLSLMEDEELALKFLKGTG